MLSIIRQFRCDINSLCLICVALGVGASMGFGAVSALWETQP